MRKTNRTLPTYTSATNPADDADVFSLSGSDDLVPVQRFENNTWVPETYASNGYSIVRYRPRTEGAFTRIERWTRDADGDVHWRTISASNGHAVYGESAAARVFDPADPSRVFEWKLERSWDDKGHCMQFEYARENTDGLSTQNAWEAHRLRDANAFNRIYLKRALYGNSAMYDGANDAFNGPNTWLFELVFDYGDHATSDPQPQPTQPWALRQDAFSSYRAGFELRTYRLCQRVLMFHRFAELNAGAPTLVKSTELHYEPSALQR